MLLQEQGLLPIFNNYFIYPIHCSDSVFLTYENNKPFASLGSKTLIPGTGVRIPSAPAQDSQPRALVSEFLRLGPYGAIGSTRCGRREAGPAGKLRNLYRTDSASQYTAYLLDWKKLNWHIAEVTFERSRYHMLFNREFGGYNVRANMLFEQEDTTFNGILNPSDADIRGDAYMLLSQMWKPYTDIRTKKYPFARDFERVVRPLFKGWWRAVWIDKGWRLFADDMDELFFAKLKIPV